MYNHSEIKNIDVLILCGGLGTRFLAVMDDRPKGLAPLGEKSLLDIIVDQLLDYGFQRFIFCVGHLRTQIIEHFQVRQSGEFLFSAEETPLGTGGALKNASSLVKNNQLLILNGDSLCPVNYTQFFQFHLQKGALLSIVLCQSQNVKEYGNVEIDENGNIHAFHEKNEKAEGGLVSAGIYLMKKKGFDLMPTVNHFSLEYEFFPKIVKTKQCWGVIVESEILDIGTPERYQRARTTYSD